MRCHGNVLGATDACSEIAATIAALKAITAGSPSYGSLEWACLGDSDFGLDSCYVRDQGVSRVNAWVNAHSGLGEPCASNHMDCWTGKCGGDVCVVAYEYTKYEGKLCRGPNGIPMKEKGKNTQAKSFRPVTTLFPHSPSLPPRFTPSKQGV